MADARKPIRIANCSGFYGDRLSAAREMVEGGPIDVLTGDWLAELTMFILFRDKMKRPQAGYARTFLKQMKEVLGTCVERGIKIVSNAGGLNPHGLAEELAKLAEEAGVSPRIAVLTGDDVSGELSGWREAGVARHLETGEPLAQEAGAPIGAHVYLGGWGIAEALRLGADVVITGRTTDAAAVVGPAAWWHGWSLDDWDALAGALVAGHVIECGTQATGGNYSFFDEVPSFENVGFPLAEIEADGSSVITKHPGTGGLVSRGTVTAQLLYEIGGPAYFSPDVVARFDTTQLEEVGPDRVRISGTRGLPAPPDLKLGVLLATGFRNQVTFLLGGDRVEERARILADQFWSSVGGKDSLQATRTDVIPGGGEGTPPWLRLSRVVVSARDANMAKLGKPFGAKAIELALSSVPGLTLEELPREPRPCGQFWPGLVPRDRVTPRLTIGGDEAQVPEPPAGGATKEPPAPQPPAAAPKSGRTVKVPLGKLAGARSGDKAGSANVGFWVKRPEAYRWLTETVTEENLRTWLGGFDGEIRIHPLPNLRALNVELVGWLDGGVATNLAPDPQAKCLAEALRAVDVEVDEALL